MGRHGSVGQTAHKDMYYSNCECERACACIVCRQKTRYMLHWYKRFCVEIVVVLRKRAIIVSLKDPVSFRNQMRDAACS